MQLQSFIFIGRSGCGKGTQIELLINKLKEIDPEHEVLYVYTGREFRNFIQGQATTQKLSKGIYDVGGLMPEFLTVYIWAKVLIDNYNNNQHIIFDGTPRKFHEAGVLHSTFDFYGIKRPWVINIDISAEEAMKRLLVRKRIDDNENDIKKRLDWYDTEVTQTIEFYKNNPDYNFLTIDGERSVEDIHNDLVEKLSLV